MPIEREVHIFLADMPFARATRMRIPPGYDAIRPIWRGMPGHPMLVRVSAAKAALGGGGEGLAGRIRTAFTEGSYGSIADIDTRAGLRRARLCGSRTPPRRSRSG
jgi:CTP:molybdopterin cytidylyltransferase MocA